MTLRFEGDSDWIEVKMDNKDNTNLPCPKGYDKDKIYLLLSLAKSMSIILQEHIDELMEKKVED